MLTMTLIGNIPQTEPGLNKTYGLTDMIFKGSCV